ncbi:MAG: Phosphoribosylglycinamide synthetase, N-domain protein, partial [Myxococcales bacterium]|nr:Phosphoribosylglycinamide synthetase, N-domain protein [Myxococcales bacterium]
AGAGGNAGGTAGGFAPVGIAVTPVGATVGKPTATLVPPTGGTVTSPDGKLTISVPAGALAAAQMLSIQPIKNTSPGGVGPGYRLQPDGQTFTAPVTLTFSYDATDVLGAAPTALRIAYQDAKGRWNSIKSVTLDDAAKTLTVQTLHFSDWSKGLAWRLDPETATVRAGDKVELTVVGCDVSTTAGDDALAGLVDTCQPAPTLLTVSGWAANAIPGGDDAVGTIVSTGPGTAEYTAPAVVPTPNPVPVTANAVDGAGHTTKVVSEMLWVSDKDHPSYRGTVTSTDTDPALGLVITTTARATMVWDIVNGWYVPGEGTLTATWDINAPPCHTHGTFTGNLGPMDGQLIVQAGVYVPEGAKMGDYVGTSACGGGAPEPFTQSENIKWWPAPIDLLFVKPDGSLEDSFTETNMDTNQVLQAQWLFIKVP